MTIPQYIMAGFIVHRILRAIYLHGKKRKPQDPIFGALLSIIQIIVLAYQDFWHWGVPQFIIGLIYFVGMTAYFKTNDEHVINAYHVILINGIFVAILDLGGFWN